MGPLLEEGVSWEELMQEEEDLRKQLFTSTIGQPVSAPAPTATTSDQPVSAPQTYAQVTSVFVPKQVIMAQKKPTPAKAAAAEGESKVITKMAATFNATNNADDDDDTGFTTVARKKRLRIAPQDSERKQMQMLINKVIQDEKDYVDNITNFCHPEIHDKTFVMLYVDARKLKEVIDASKDEHYGLNLLSNLAKGLIALKDNLNGIGMISRFYSGNEEPMPTPFKDFKANYKKHVPKIGVACYEVGLSYNYNITVQQLFKGTKYANVLAKAFAAASSSSSSSLIPICICCLC